jgi:hypothetical protein
VDAASRCLGSADERIIAVIAVVAWVQSIPDDPIVLHQRVGTSELHHHAGTQDDFASAKIRVPVARLALTGDGIGTPAHAAGR